MRATTEGKEHLHATGADPLPRIVNGALKKYRATQHLIGTQLVEIKQLRRDSYGSMIAGEATMSSYVYAWHACPNDVRIVLGTYQDKVHYIPGAGWKIYDMELVQLSSENGKLIPWLTTQTLYSLSITARTITCSFLPAGRAQPRDCQCVFG